MSEDTKARLDEAVEKAKEALKGDDVTAFNEAGDELSQAFGAAGKEMYEQHVSEAAEAGAPEEGGAGFEAEPETEAGAEAGVEEDVVEAEYEIVDEEK